MSHDVSHHRPFLALWVLAVAASVTAFVLHLAMRSKTMHLGYELGKARAEQARLREVKRVLELEVASYHTPQRVEVVARTLLSMEPPAADRIIAMGPLPTGTSGSSLAAAPAPKAGARGAAVASSSAAAAHAAPPVATEIIAPRITPPKPAAVAVETGGSEAP